MQTKNPFHPGEILAQQLAGQRANAERNGTIISDSIMPSALPFLRQQQLFLVGSNSPNGRLWSSVLFGPKGFLESEDGRILRIRLDSRFVDSSDPLWKNIGLDPRLGGLAIELATRRRLRINGRVIAMQPELLTVAVDEAYPNCPKYIQSRVPRPEAAMEAKPISIESGRALTDVTRPIVETADTMFVASANPNGGIDVSHRGGNPGFVLVRNEYTLSVPDYPGNSMFNTFGNLLLNPAAGILIVDFAKGWTLQLTGKAKVHWHEAEGIQDGGPSGRSWMFSIEGWRLHRLPFGYQWEFGDYSPFNPA